MCHTYQHKNESAASSLKLYAQAKLSLIDSFQNGTCADHYTWVQVHDLAFRHHKPDWNVLLTLAVDSSICSNIRHSNEGQNTGVKLCLAAPDCFAGSFFYPLRSHIFYIFQLIFYLITGSILYF